MAICMCGVAVLLLTGSIAPAAGVVGQTEVPVLATGEPAYESACLPEPSPALTLPGDGLSACAASDWQAFRHGCWWDDYCLDKQLGAAACPAVTRPLPTYAAPGRPTLWPWRAAPDCCCRSCRTRPTPALDALCRLLGWNRSSSCRVVCRVERGERVPGENMPLDDPAPLPPELPPLGDDAADQQDPPITPPVDDTTDMEPVPVPEQTREGADASDGMELAPTPPDDPAPAPAPAPAPKLEIPRNQLPKSEPAAPAALDTTRATSGRKAVKVHLSDFIRTRE